MVSHRESTTPEPMTCTLVRVSRPDTAIVRTYCPHIQSMVNVYLVLEGIECRPEAQEEIERWCDIHAESDRLKLVTWQWFRDQYGRVLGDIADISSGESLTDYLQEAGLATYRPDHYLEVIREMGP